jgi:hypothetical protein
LRRLGKSRRSSEGLPEERKALAERYTIDAAEAQRREVVAAEAPAARRPESTPLPAAPLEEPPSTWGQRPSAGDLRRAEGLPFPADDRPTLKEHVDGLLGMAGMKPKNPYDTKTMQYFLSVYRARNTEN